MEGSSYMDMRQRQWIKSGKYSGIDDLYGRSRFGLYVNRKASPQELRPRSSAVNIGSLPDISHCGRQNSTLHGIEETFFVDEGDFDYCFPVLLLSVQIEFKVGGVELDDRRTWFGHEILNVRPLKSRGNTLNASGRSLRLLEGRTPINCSNGLKG